MLRINGRSAIVAMVLIAAAVWHLGPVQAEPSLSDLLYGVRHSTEGGKLFVGDVLIELPDSHRVIDIESRGNKAWLAVCFPNGPVGEYVSELWQVDIDRSDGIADIAKRKVLASYSLQGGEGLSLCHSIVSCENAVALFVQQWEGGIIRVFDADGIEFDIPRPSRVLQNGRTDRFDWCRPIGWLPGSSNQTLLVCMAAEPGDLVSFIAIFDLEAGSVEVGPLGSVLGEIGNDLFIGFSNNEW